MVNVTHTHQLFPTLLHEFIYEVDEDLKSSIKNQDVIRHKKSHTCGSNDKNLHLKPEFEGFVNKVVSTTKDIIKIYDENPQVKEMMLTGGSPTMHAALVNEITYFAKERGILVTIETEGSHFLETDNLEVFLQVLVY